METATAAPSKKRAQKDVHAIINDAIIVKLEQGIAPWRVPWTAAGGPTNLISQKPYRGINVMLLAMHRYERNLFITENQLQEINGAIKPNEKPHVVVFWNNKEQHAEVEDDLATDRKKSGTLNYYRVYNIAQCVGISAELIPESAQVPDALTTCEKVLSEMAHCPSIKHKEASPYYDPIEDFVNMPRKTSFASAEDYYRVLFHQLAHSTGHHTRLDRLGLIQMFEVGYASLSPEEMVAELTTCFLQSFTGIPGVYDKNMPECANWLHELKKNRFLIFNASSLAQKAIDFILNIQSDVEEKQ